MRRRRLADRARRSQAARRDGALCGGRRSARAQPPAVDRATGTSGARNHRSARGERDEQAAVLVVGGEEVDRYRLRIAARVESSSWRPSFPTPHSRTMPIGSRSESVCTSPIAAPHQLSLLEARQLETPRPAASTRCSRRTDEAGGGGRVVVLEQLEDEPESAAAALKRVRAAEAFEAVDVDPAVLGSGRCRRARPRRRHRHWPRVPGGAPKPCETLSTNIARRRAPPQ